VLAEAFRRHGLAVWVARDGGEAERLCASVEPHALVLDLLLPDRDGFAVVESMRSRDRLGRTPMVVYTALELDPQQRAELRLGPTEYYTKGRVSPQQIEERVLELLRGVAPDAGARADRGGDG
jgi:CheY-like chemotaxis protein